MLDLMLGIGRATIVKFYHNIYRVLSELNAE